METVLAFYMIIAGIALILAEVLMPLVGLIGLLGVAMFFTGLLMQVGVIAPVDIGLTVQVLFAFTLFLSIVAAGVMYFAMQSRKKTEFTGKNAMIGEKADVIEWNGKEGRINYRGENWQAFCDEERDLKAGERVHISDIDDLLVKITPKV